MQIYFPYEKVREEQKKLINDITTTIIDGKVLLAHAPTGLGKTVSSLAPAISCAIEQKKKIFFLTPKISQHEIVLETVKLMNQKFNLNIKSVDLVGRKSMCIDPFLSNVKFGFYDACSKKKKDGKCKYYNNVKGKTPKQRAIAHQRKAVLLKKFNSSHLETKEDCFMKEICPYELTLERCKNADVIIADYSHIFDEGIRETILSQANIKIEDVIIIVDEAHNLAERIRDMYTISLGADLVGQAQKEARSLGDFDVEFVLKDLEKELLALAKNLSFEKREDSVDEIELDLLKKIIKPKMEALADAGTTFMTKRKVENCSIMRVLEFLEIVLMKKKSVLNIIERKQSLSLTITPLDVSFFSKQVFDLSYSAILMSGTLLPLQMYVHVLGIDEKKANLYEYASPFPKENRLNLFVNKTSTKYTSRNDGMYNEIAGIVNGVIPKIPGNSIVFFPSFEILETIAPLINTSRKVLKQERESSTQEKSNLIHNFRALGTGFGGVLLAVSGGSIAEGIDFPGDHLYGAIVVGIPFAKVSLQSQSLINFYQNQFSKGWEYAYNAPAISKSIQAAGRVIRTETDRGVCIFLDQRFCEKRFEQFFPKDFEREIVTDPKEKVEAFFR
ncbi:MAG: ATP-dependent DNA helicase [archaeon]|jgi:DNA excision repair protein ERCC-2